MSEHVKEHANLGNVEGIRTAIQGFVTDPPDSDFQCGYLGAMLSVANYALGVARAKHSKSAVLVSK